MSESQLIGCQPNQRHDKQVVQWVNEHKNELLTPLYLYSEAALQQNVALYRAIFPPTARGFYALKANPQPDLVKQFSSLKIGGEVTGFLEWQLCNQAGIPSSNVLVGGVAKSEEFLEAVCQSGPAAIVIESETEWRRLQRVTAHSHPVQILLRINPGVSFGGLNMAGGSQFGLSTQQALVIAQQILATDRIKLLGLHFYFGSQRLEVAPIIQAIEVVEQTIQTFQTADVEIQVVDLGLGCGVPYLAKDKPLDMLALCNELQRRWQNSIWANIEVWFEAGRVLVASSGYFIARVIDRKQLHGETFVFLDGGLNVHNPGVGLGGFLRRNPEFCFITDSNSQELVHIVGNLCTTADTLGTNVLAPQLQEGDLVIIPNSGAYCQTTAMWGFNSQPLFHEALLTQDGSFRTLQPQYHFLVK